MLFRFPVVYFVTLFAASISLADGSKILLKTGDVTPNRSASTTPVRASAKKTLASTGSDFRVYLVQGASSALLSEKGAAVYRWLPGEAYLIGASSSVASVIEALDGLTHFSEYTPEQRIEPAVAKFIAESPSEIREYRVSRFAGKTEVEKLDAKGVNERANEPNVEWISFHHSKRLMCDVAMGDRGVKATKVWPSAPSSDLELTGRGICVAVADTGLDTGVMSTLNADFGGRRIVAMAMNDRGKWSDPDGHGTHVAGIAVGNGANSSGQFRGCAYEADLIFQSVLDADDSLRIFLPSEQFAAAYTNATLQAKIHNNSWGDTRNVYDESSQDIDDFMFKHLDFLAVFSAGNEGVDWNMDGVTDPGSLCVEANSKNALVVGASESFRTTGGLSETTYYSNWKAEFPAAPLRNDLVSWPYDNVHQGLCAFSSRGPCEDGRIKPDIVVPGTDIISVRSAIGNSESYWGDYDDFYAYLGGTSMAAPLVSGAAALCRQFLIEDCNIPNPDATTIKAMLCGGARSLYPGQFGDGIYREIEDFYPNSQEGWGQADLERTFDKQAGMAIFDAQVIANAETNSYVVTAQEGKPLNIMMAYADAPAALNAAVALVNNLDLVVESPSGIKLWSNCYKNGDAWNNVEGVIVTSAEAGDYKVKVIASRVAMGMNPALTGGRSSATRFSLVALGGTALSDSTEARADLAPATTNAIVFGTEQDYENPTDDITEDSQVWMRFTIRNRGDAAVEDPFVVSVLTNGICATNLTVDMSIAAHTAMSRQMSFGRMPAGITSCSLIIDAADVIAESREYNNTCSNSLLVLKRQSIEFVETEGESKSHDYYVGIPFGELPTAERYGYSLIGWFDAAEGGNQILSETIVQPSHETLYAHWHELAPSLEFAEESAPPDKSATYNGWAVSVADGSLVGTVSAKVAKKKADGTSCRAIAFTITYRGEPKSLKLNLDESKVELSDKRLRTQLLIGDFDCEIECVRDFVAAKKNYPVEYERLSSAAGTYILNTYAKPKYGDFRGFVGLSIAVKANGNAKVSGVLPDGSKISSTAKVVLDDNGLYIPIFSKIYSKKGDFCAFIVNITDGSVLMSDLGFWFGPVADGYVLCDLQFNTLAKLESSPEWTAGWMLNPYREDGVTDPWPERIEGSLVWDESIPSELAFSFEGKSWVCHDSSSTYSGMKLKYDAKKGTISGSFKLRTNAKTYKAQLNGVWIPGTTEAVLNASVKKEAGFGMTLKK